MNDYIILKYLELRFSRVLRWLVTVVFCFQMVRPYICIYTLDVLGTFFVVYIIHI